jgi:hypothetical protein
VASFIARTLASNVIEPLEESETLGLATARSSALRSRTNAFAASSSRKVAISSSSRQRVACIQRSNPHNRRGRPSAFRNFRRGFTYCVRRVWHASKQETTRDYTSRAKSCCNVRAGGIEPTILCVYTNTYTVIAKARLKPVRWVGSSRRDVKASPSLCNATGVKPSMQLSAAKNTPRSKPLEGSVGDLVKQRLAAAEQDYRERQN